MSKKQLDNDNDDDDDDGDDGDNNNNIYKYEHTLKMSMLLLLAFSSFFLQAKIPIAISNQGKWKKEQQICKLHTINILQNDFNRNERDFLHIPHSLWMCRTFSFLSVSLFLSIDAVNCLSLLFVPLLRLLLILLRFF